MEFDDLSKIYKQMLTTEYYKFLKDYKMEKYISLDEVTAINRQCHTKFSNEKGEKLQMDFKDFCSVNLQCAVLMFSRDPINLGHLPGIFQLNKFIEFVKIGFQEAKKPLELFDNPDAASIIADSEIVEYLNKNLEKDPEFVLPHTYEKYA